MQQFVHESSVARSAGHTWQDYAPLSWDAAAADRPLVLRLPSGLLPTEDVDSMEPPKGGGDRRPLLYSASQT
jgi:hypothetical protein